MGGQPPDGLDFWAERIGQHLRDVSGHLLVEASRGAFGQARTYGFGGSSSVVDKERSGTNESIPAAKKRKICLGFCSSVLDRAEQPRINPPKTSKRLSVYPVTLAVVLVDETQAPRVGHDGFVTLPLMRRLIQGECVPASSTTRDDAADRNH